MRRTPCIPPVVTISWRRCWRGCHSAVWGGGGGGGGVVGNLAQPTRGATRRRRLVARTWITVADPGGSCGAGHPPSRGGPAGHAEGPAGDPAGPSAVRARSILEVARAAAEGLP